MVFTFELKEVEPGSALVENLEFGPVLEEKKIEKEPLSLIFFLFFVFFWFG
jgi:hypothetical protein